MKELLLQYARFNVWANDLTVNAMLPLAPSLLDQELVSSFPSLRKTVYHMWSAEAIWLQRLNLVEKPTWAAGSFTGSFDEACALWQQASAGLLSYTTAANNDSLNAVLSYHDTKGNPWHRPVWQVLQHVSNHATYHRGQLVTMLRQVGVTTIPPVDFIYFMNLPQHP